jgi:hypothetical protein
MINRLIHPLIFHPLVVASKQEPSVKGYVVHPYSSIDLEPSSYQLYNSHASDFSEVEVEVGQLDGRVIEICDGYVAPGIGVFLEDSFLLESFAKIHFSRALTSSEECETGTAIDTLNANTLGLLTGIADSSVYEDKCVASICSLFGSNFGHWHIETLSSIKLAQSVNRDCYLYVPRLKAWQAEVLRCSGLDLSRLVEVEPGFSLKAKTVLYPSPCWLYHTALQYVPRNYLYSSFLSIQRTALQESSWQGKQRVFIARPPASNRELVNLRELASLLSEKYSFAIVSPESLAYIDQVKLFSSAECIIGCSGAAFALLPFCKPSCQVIEISYEGGWHGFWSSWSSTFTLLNHIVYIEEDDNLEREESLDGLSQPTQWCVDLLRFSRLLDRVL